MSWGYVMSRSPLCVLDDYRRHKELKEETIKWLSNYPDKQGKSTNVKATMTEWNITSPEIEILKKEVVYRINKIYRTEWKFEYSALWANIYKQGDYTIYHDHIPCSFSFVYFLKSEEHFSPLCINKNILFRKTIKPKEGRLVIFYSNIEHGVPKHKHKETRITLAGNLNNKS